MTRRLDRNIPVDLWAMVFGGAPLAWGLAEADSARLASSRAWTRAR